MTSEEIIPPGEESTEGRKSPGIPKPPPEIMQQQQQAPLSTSYPAYYPPHRKNFFESLVKNPTVIGIMIIISLALMWLGVTIFAIGIASYSWRASVISMIVYSIGTAFLVITLLGLGIGRHDYPQWVRVALILVAGMIVVWGFYFNGALMGSMAVHYSP